GQSEGPFDDLSIDLPRRMTRRDIIVSSSVSTRRMPQRSGLLPYRCVLSFLSKAREASGSEAAHLYHAARRRGSVAACGACAAAGEATNCRVLGRQHTFGGK